MEIKKDQQNSSANLFKKSGISFVNVFNELNHENYQFKTPRQAPVYRPTKEEFELGPLNYIAKIREEAEQFGICKIIPPSCFQPPFTLDVDNFRFTPRIQRLNELEAQTRVRLCFLEKLIKYWSLQSHQIKIPSIDKQVLDLYKLHKVVDEEGGFDICSKDRKWSIVACKMGFNCTPQNKGTIASLLRHHYEKILYPYDLFVNGVTYDESTLDELKETLNNDHCKDDSFDSTSAKDIKEELSDESLNNSESEKMEIGETRNNDENNKPAIRRSSRRMQGQSLCNVKLENSNKELARLQVYSPGPKMSGFSSTDEEKNKKNSSRFSSSECVQCGENINQSQSIQCSTCNNNFHIKCLIPPLKITSDVLKSEWNCPRCIAYLIQTQPQSYDTSFGFVQSSRTYSITEFGEIADQFKSNYFNMPCHAVPLELAEKEFWRLISSYDEQDAVTVEYGADLHTNDFGSGFPTHRNPKLLAADLEYLDHAWNLNNLPVLEGSVFKYINTNISGMVVPWNYIGMCFSTFCWHNEDHWSYSINYLHWGEQKCWYGCPGSSAEKFEEAMKSVAPELFKSQPDLLHQLVTICNPNVLESLGVPICTTNQHAGEFIITFPRAYHSGFNHGLNFAEAVNFSPADWLKIGRQCIDNYSMLKRYPVFSHDELVCKMANDPDILDISLAEATYLDLLEMVEAEKLKRQDILDLGIRKSVRETFELLQDDERQCDYCKTACFLSAISCDCSDCKLVCLKHADKLCTNCKFEDMTLRYRYTLDELPLMLEKMNKRKNEYQHWSNKVESFFETTDQETSTSSTLNNHQSSSIDKVSLTDFQRHLNEVRTKNYPKDNEIFLKIKETIEHATKLSKTAKDILEQQKILDDINEQIAKSNRLKNDHLRKSYQKQAKKPVEESIVLRSSTKTKKSKDQDEERTKLGFVEFKEFVDEINNLPCTIPESDLINQLYNRCDTIKKSIEEITNYTKEESEDLSSDFIDQLIFEANCISIVDFDDKLDIIRYKLNEIRWIEKCKEFLNNQEDNRKKRHQIEMSTLDTMIDLSKELLVSTNISQELILQLLNLKQKAENWISKTKGLIDLPEQKQLEEKNEFDINLYDKLPIYDEFESLIKEVEDDNDLVKVNLSPHLEKVHGILTNATDWLNSYEKLFPSTEGQSKESLPFFDQIEELFIAGTQLGCKLDQMCKLHSTFKLFKNWREKLMKLFMKKNSIYNLFSILLPRTKSSVPQSIDLVNMSSKLLYLQLKKIYSQQSSKDQSKIDWFKKRLDNKMTRESIEKVYKEAILNEEVCMKQIKERNLIKLHSVTDNDSPSRLQDKSTDFETEDDIYDKDFDLKKKKFCICGKKPSDWMIQCVLCQEYFHAKNCLKMKKIIQVNQLNNGTTVDNTNQDNLDRDNSFFVCLLCNRGKRPNLDLVVNLSDQISSQKLRIMENELLLCIINRANKFRHNLQKELNTRTDLKEAYDLVVKAFNGLLDGNSTANSAQTSANLDNEALIKKKKLGHQPNKIKDLNINLNDQTKNILYNLIWDCSLLQVNLVELKYLWEIYCQANPEFKTSIYVTETSSFVLPITENYVQYKLNETTATTTSSNSSTYSGDNKKRKIDQPSKPINSKSKKSKNQKSNQNGKSKSSNSGSENDICDLNENCLRPRSKNVDWVFCEGCKSWLHFLCCGISTDEIDKVKEFFCSKCLNEKEPSKTEENELNTKSENSSLPEQVVEDSCKELKVNELDSEDELSKKSEAAKSILSLSNLGLDLEQEVNQQASSPQQKTTSTLVE